MNMSFFANGVSLSTSVLSPVISFLCSNSSSSNSSSSSSSSSSSKGYEEK